MNIHERWAIDDVLGQDDDKLLPALERIASESNDNIGAVALKWTQGDKEILSLVDVYKKELGLNSNCM